MSNTTTLGSSLNNGEFLATLREHIQETADRDKRGLGGDTAWAKRHVSALLTFDDYLSGLGLDDQRLVALSQITLAVFSTRQYKPTQWQVRLLAKLGETDAPPSSEDTLGELVAAATFDTVETLRSAQTEAAAANQKVEAKEAELGAAADRITELDTELMAARDEIVAVGEEKTELQENVNTLRRFLSDAPRPGTAPDWVVVEGHPGVYEKENAAGETVYRVGWKEDGKQRWKQRAGLDLDGAIALRAEMAGKTTEPETVPA